jgi:hypothetical protein
MVCNTTCSDRDVGLAESGYSHESLRDNKSPRDNKTSYRLCWFALPECWLRRNVLCSKSFHFIHQLFASYRTQDNRWVMLAFVQEDKNWPDLAWLRSWANTPKRY